MAGPSIEDYHIGWICALPKEMTAALAMLDEEYPILKEQQHHDNNNYALGRIHRHNVVVACMPAGADGLVNAANVASDMARTFPALRVCLMVGIGGGIPNLEKGIDIRLGDIVVSQPDGTFGGVVQYDKGKAENGGEFVLKGQLNQPPPILLQTLSRLQAEHDRRDSWISRYMKEAIERNPRMAKTGYIFPTNPDHLHCPECGRDIEVEGADCTSYHGRRAERSDNDPVIHYGIVASANRVVKDAEVRDYLRDNFNALCVEMEAAGLMNHFPCLVIRGTCDYADAHKNDAWHPYAAMTAAAYAKELLYYVSPTQASHEKPIQLVIDKLDELSQNSAAQLAVSQEHLRLTKRHFEQSHIQYESDKHAQCHQAFRTSSYEDHKDVNLPRVEGTCQWVLSHPRYKDWSESSRDDLLWISADPGCGKSVLARSLIENELQSTETHIVCYFFFKDSDQQDSVTTALCAMLHQLFAHRRQLIRHAIQAWDMNGANLTGQVSELWRIWLTAAKDAEANHVTCILDALDECKEADRNKIFGLLTDFYSQSLTSSESRRGRLKFLVTSRPYDGIRRGFSAIHSNLPAIQLRGEYENDKISQEIDLVIHTRVLQLETELRLKFHTARQLENKLLGMKHRTYLWLHLATDDIYHSFRKSLRRDQQSINLIPSTVEQAYEKILGRIGQDDEATVKHILQIVVGARRPLTIKEMAIALGIAASPDSESLQNARVDHENLGDRIRDLCGLFIFINHSKIHLIHQTAKEFLICPGGFTASISGWKHCLDPSTVENEMARICVEFFFLKDIQPTIQSLVDRIKTEGHMPPIQWLFDEKNEVESFAVYSAEYWHSHVRSGSLHTRESLFGKVFQLYETGNDLRNQWFNIYWKIIRFWMAPPVMNDLQLAAFLGHDQVLSVILDQDNYPGINLTDDNGSIAIYWASAFGHPKVVNILLGKGANANAHGGHYSNALQAASLGGHLEVVNILLSNGADVNAHGGFYGNALEAASLRGHIEVVNILLSNGADVNAHGGSYGNALEAASSEGHSEVVNILLSNGANVNTHGSAYGNALQAASLGGHLEVINILLSNGADVNAQGGNYGSALRAASSEGHLEVVNLLKANGALEMSYGSEDSMEI